MSYNLLERRLLLAKSEFWTCLIIGIIPDKFFKNKPGNGTESVNKEENGTNECFIKEEIYLRVCLVVYLILVMPLVSIILICPLLDILLHIPWNAEWNTQNFCQNKSKDGDQKDSTQGDKTSPNDRTQGDNPSPNDRTQGNNPSPNNRTQGNNPSPNDRTQGDNPSPNDRTQGDNLSLNDRTQGGNPSPNDRTQADNPFPNERTQGGNPSPNDRTQDASDCKCCSCFLCCCLCCVSHGKGKKDTKNNSKESPSKIMLRVMATFTLVLFAVTFAVSYIYPTAKLYSLIVSYTITGILKNYKSILPLIMLMAFILSRMIKICNHASDSFVRLQMMIFNEWEARTKGAEYLNLIKWKQGDYKIKREFVENYCQKWLCRPKIYNFIGLAKIIALTTAGAVVWVCLSVLEYSSLGQILLTGFVAWLPKFFESIGKPWHDEKNKILLQKKIKEKVAKEMNEIQGNLNKGKQVTKKRKKLKWKCKKKKEAIEEKKEKK